MQASRLLNGWENDADVDAWIVPVNPIPPKPFDRLLQIKYVRTIVTQLCYWPLLIRELRRADVVHIFSASYSSFLLAPLPAVIVSRLLGKPVLLNYHSGEAEDHLRRSWIARRTLRRHVDVNVVPSTFLREVMARFGIAATVVSNTVDRREFTYRARDLRRPALTLLSTRNFEPHYNVACTLRAFARVQARFPDVSLTLVGSGSQERSLKALAADLGLRGVTFVGAVAPHADRRLLQHRGPVRPDTGHRQHAAVDPRSLRQRPSRCLHVRRRRARRGQRRRRWTARPGRTTPTRSPRESSSSSNAPTYAQQLAAAAHEKSSRYDWADVRDSWLAVYRALAQPDAGATRPLEVQRSA